MFADQTERGRPVEPQLGKCLARLADEGVQLPIGHGFAYAGEGRLGGIAKHSIEQPGWHLEGGEVTDRAGRNRSVADQREKEVDGLRDRRALRPTDPLVDFG